MRESYRPFRSAKATSLDILSLISANRKTRVLVCLYLHLLLSVEEIRGLRDAFRAVSPKGVITYLNVMKRKSYWRFVDTALEELLSYPSDATFDFVRRVISGRGSIFERLPDDLRSSIEQKTSHLTKADDGRLKDSLRLLELTMRSA